MWCIMGCCTMSNYQTPATGRLWTPAKDNGQIKREEALDQIERLSDETPLVSSDGGHVFVDEVYYHHGQLHLSVLFDEWFVSLDVPLRPSQSLQKLLAELTEAFDVTARSSGHYVSNSDLLFVDRFTPDAQGRVTVGREYADDALQLVGVDP